MKIVEGKANGHYSPAIISGGQVFVSGQLSRDPLTGLIPGTVKEETFQSLANVKNILKAAGSSMEDIVMCRVYVAGISLWDQVNAAYEEFFGDHKPARVVVPVAELHFGCHVEIEAVAELGCGGCVKTEDALGLSRANEPRASINDLDTPSLIVDEEIMKSNIAYMVDYAKENNVSLRPHTKTHKTPALALLCRQMGAKGIAVAKTGEAEVMAENGLTDIFIANEIASTAKLERIRKLAETIDISFGADCVDQLKMVEQVFAGAKKKAQVMIEIEVGEVRSGVVDERTFVRILQFIGASENIELRGVFSHDGNSYHAKDTDDLVKIAVGAQERTLEFVKMARDRGFECPVVSYGATPTFMNGVPILDGITELRPGTFIFMDASQGAAIGSLKRCAASVLATVISKPTDARVVLDVGAKGLTMQERHGGICGIEGLGVIMGYDSVVIDRMSDEHAVIENKVFHDQVVIGQKVRIIPVHICPVCNLYDSMFLVRGEQVIEELPILCRGKLY